MLQYIEKRLLQAIPAVFGISIIVFLLLHASGDPAMVAMDTGSTKEEIAAYRKAWGLDQPLHVQYLSFVWRAAKGDFGMSMAYGRPAGEVVWNRLPNTIQLALLSVLISLAVGVPAGIIAALKRNTIFDYALMLIVAFGQSVAQFWLGLMLILFFSVKLNLLPTSGMGSGASWIKHIILPALTLSPWLMTLSARLVRSGMLEVMRQDYIRTAYAKGLSEKIVLTRHALRNALIPLLTMTGLGLGYMMGGAIIVEIIFAWPGMGQLAYSSVLRRDYNVVLCICMLVASAFVVINLVVDIIIGTIDPRYRAKIKGGS